MGISMLTGMIIATRGDDIKTTAAFDEEKGKWLGWITLGEEDRYRPLLNSQAIYNTAEDAILAMNKVVNDIRQSDLVKKVNL